MGDTGEQTSSAPILSESGAISSAPVPPESDSSRTPQEESSLRDRRRHPRYPCYGRAEIFLPHGGLMIRGRILDLSLAGCFIESPSINLERGTQVEIFFETKQLQFRVAGNIAILHHRSGVGVSFQGLSFRIARQLQQLIKELAEGS